MSTYDPDALEVQVGTVLIVRTRPLKPTTSSGAAHDEERISIAINADSIGTWALPALGALAREGLGLEVITDDQDFTIEWLREGKVLGCVTTLRQALRSCRLVPLGSMRYVAVAEPDYAARYAPDGLTTRNFHQVPFIAFNRKDSLQMEFVSSAMRLKRVALKQLYVPSSEGQVREHLRSGRLVNMAPDG